MTEHIYELDNVIETVAAQIPPRIVESINRYVWHGCPTGDFLRSVLSNDLMNAVARADADSMASLQAICMYIHNAVPSGITGGHEEYKKHIERGTEHVRQTLTANEHSTETR